MLTDTFKRLQRKYPKQLYKPKKPKLRVVYYFSELFLKDVHIIMMYKLFHFVNIHDACFVDFEEIMITKHKDNPKTVYEFKTDKFVNISCFDFSKSKPIEESTYNNIRKITKLETKMKKICKEIGEEFPT